MNPQAVRQYVIDTDMNLEELIYERLDMSLEDIVYELASRFDERIEHFQDLERHEI